MTADEWVVTRGMSLFMYQVRIIKWYFLSTKSLVAASKHSCTMNRGKECTDARKEIAIGRGEGGGEG